MNVHFPQGELACSETYGIGKSLSCFCSVILSLLFSLLPFPSLFSFSLLINFLHFLSPSLALSLSYFFFVSLSSFFLSLRFPCLHFPSLLSSLPLPLSQYQHRISISSLRMVLLSVVMLCHGLYSHSGIGSLRSEFPCRVIISSDFM